MAFTKNEQARAFLAIALLYGIWHTTWEWWRLLVVHVQLTIEDRLGRPIVPDVIFLQTLSNIFILLGSLIFGQLIDTLGTRLTAFVSVLVTGVLYILHSQMDTYSGFVWIMPMFVAHQLPQLCEAYVAIITDESKRVTSTMRLRFPVCIAVVLGPCISIFVTKLNDETSDSQMVAGIVLLVLSLPIIFFMLPEPSPARSDADSKNQATKEALSGGYRFKDYLELLKNGAVQKTLFVQFLLDGPYQYYDYLRRQYVVSQYLIEATDVVYLLLIVGAVTIFANFCLIQWAQQLFPNRQRRLQVMLGVLAVLYLVIGLSVFHFQIILVCVPLQIACVSVVYADLLTQLTVGVASVDKKHFSKVISLARFTQLLAGAVMPLLAVYLTKEFHFDWWCYVASIASAVVVVVLQLIGGFMSVSHSKLPSYYIAYA